jgi:putative hydrolase of the HAD superfamily
VAVRVAVAVAGVGVPSSPPPEHPATAATTAGAAARRNHRRERFVVGPSFASEGMTGSVAWTHLKVPRIAVPSAERGARSAFVAVVPTAGGMSDVEAVLFDLDDTLCEYERSGAELLAAAYDDVGVDPVFDVEEYYARYEDYADDSDGIRELRANCFADLAAEYGRDPELGRALARAYAEERDHSNVRFVAGAREAFETVSDRYRVGMVTNGAPGMQRRKLAGVGLDGAFETVVYAGYDAPAKPAPDPFHRALSAMGVDPGRAVHVGNSPSSDVDGAKAAGLRAALLAGGMPTEGEATPDYHLETMHDLVSPPWE